MSFLRGAGKPAATSIHEKNTNENIPKAELEIIAGVVEQLKSLGVVMAQQGATEESNPTYRAVMNAHRIIEDAGVRFQLADGNNPFKKVAVLNDFVKHKVKYLGDMKSMAQGFKQIVVTKETVAAWLKLADWMDALHECSASRLRKAGEGKDVEVKRLDDGTFPWADLKDLAFKKATEGTAKYTLTRYYGKGSKLIMSKIAELNNQNIADNEDRPALRASR